MIMSKSKYNTKKTIFSIVITIQLITAFTLLTPIKSFGIKQPSTVPTPSDCRLQYVNPIAMNTVIAGAAVKTIHVEKKTFECAQGLFDQDIYLIIYEDTPGSGGEADRVLPPNVVTCAKNNTGDVLGCEERSPYTYRYTPISGPCQQVSLTWPLQMNTAVAPNGVIKTVETQDEVFGCPTIVSPRFLKDVTIFTVVSDAIGPPPLQPYDEARFHAITCTEVVANLNVTGCITSYNPVTLPHTITSGGGVPTTRP